MKKIWKVCGWLLLVMGILLILISVGRFLEDQYFKSGRQIFWSLATFISFGSLAVFIGNRMRKRKSPLPKMESTDSAIQKLTKILRITGRLVFVVSAMIAYLMMLALLLVKGCNPTSHDKIKYGPFSAESFHETSGFTVEGSSRVWCELKINGKRFTGPKEWALIKYCSPAGENPTIPVIVVDAYDDSGAKTGLHHYLVVVKEKAITLIDIGSWKKRFYWSSDGRRVFIPRRDFPEDSESTDKWYKEYDDIILDPLTGEEVATKIPGHFVDFSPDYKRILSYKNTRGVGHATRSAPDENIFYVSDVMTRTVIQQYPMTSTRYPWIKDLTRSWRSHFTWVPLDSGGFQLRFPDE